MQYKLQFKALSVLSTLVAILATTQAAPLLPVPVGVVLFFTANLDDPKGFVSGVAVRASSFQPAPEKWQSLSCWDREIDGRVFAISCSGSSWYVWTDCTNGYRFTTGPISGSYRITMTCPAGYTVIQGDAYGY